MKKVLVMGFLLLGIFAGSGSVDGAIVYSGLRDVPMPHFPTDEEVRRERIVFAGGDATLSVFNTWSRAEVFLLSANRSGVYATVSTDSPFVDSFDFGQVIGNELEWSGFASRWLADYSENAEGFRGHFFDQENGFVALRTTVEEDVYYGWLRLSHSAADAALTVHDWAWNSAPGEPILAGEIPEPKVYALVLGIGVLVWVVVRRRRRHHAKWRTAR